MALAAKRTNLVATIYLPSDASKMKVDAIKGLGAEIVQMDYDCGTIEVKSREIADNEGKYFISPYNDIDIIAG